MSGVDDAVVRAFESKQATGVCGHAQVGAWAVPYPPRSSSQQETLSQIDGLIALIDNTRTLKTAAIDTIRGFGLPEVPGLISA